MGCLGTALEVLGGEAAWVVPSTPKMKTKTRAAAQA